MEKKTKSLPTYPTLFWHETKNQNNILFGLSSKNYKNILSWNHWLYNNSNQLGWDKCNIQVVQEGCKIISILETIGIISVKVTDTERIEHP